VYSQSFTSLFFFTQVPCSAISHLSKEASLKKSGIHSGIVSSINFLKSFSEILINSQKEIIFSSIILFTNSNIKMKIKG